MPEMTRRALLSVAASTLVSLPAGAESPATIEKVENGGLLFTDNPAGVSGTDAGFSISLDRQSLWIFGDVFLRDVGATRDPYVGTLSNCALLVPKGSGAAPLHRYRFLTDAQTGLARAVIPNAVDDGKEVRYWPFGGTYDAARKRVYLYYARVVTTGQGPFAFRTEGLGLAAADATRPELITFTRLPGPRDMGLWWTREKDGVVFGNAVVSESRGDWLYVVGMSQGRGRKRARMVRVPRDRIEDRDEYEYFAGGSEPPRWTRDVGQSADVEGLNDFPSELSVSYNPYLGGYLAVHSVDIVGRLRFCLAPQPWGPYETIGEIAAPARALSKGFSYAGKEHPELAEQGGRVVYVTYVDSERYWLQLLKVTLRRR